MGARAWQAEGLGSSSAAPLTCLGTLHRSLHLSACRCFGYETGMAILPKTDVSGERASVSGPRTDAGAEPAPQVAAMTPVGGPAMPGGRRAQGSLRISSLGVARAREPPAGCDDQGGTEKRVAGWTRPHPVHGKPCSLATRPKPGSALRAKVVELVGLQAQRAGTGPQGTLPWPKEQHAGAKRLG